MNKTLKTALHVGNLAILALVIGLVISAGAGGEATAGGGPTTNGVTTTTEPEPTTTTTTTTTVAPSGPVEICHKGRTITVNARALRAHEAHGDTLGPCRTTTTTTAAGQ